MLQLIWMLRVGRHHLSHGRLRRSPTQKSCCESAYSILGLGVAGAVAARAGIGVANGAWSPIEICDM